MQERIKLGAFVKDKVTDFCGILVARTEYLYSENRVGVLAQKLKADGTNNERWFSEDEIIEITPVLKRPGK